MTRKKYLFLIFSFISLFIITVIFFNFLKTHEKYIEINGVKREYLIHSPKSSGKMPLVIALHGYKDNPRLMEFYSGLSRKADQEKFIVVYPYGTKSDKDKNLSWNGGSCCGNGVLEEIDDVGYINSLVDMLIKNNNIDPEKVFLVGFSNGGLLTYKIASETPDRYKAVAIVSGSIGGKVYKKIPPYIIPKPKKPISVLAIHGMKDSRIPYEGGLNINKDGSFKSFEDSKELWKKINECSNSINSENNLVIHESSPDCKDGVKSEFYSVKSGGHVWPGSVLEILKKIKNQSFPATDVIWNFFRS